MMKKCFNSTNGLVATLGKMMKFMDGSNAKFPLVGTLGKEERQVAVD